MASSTIVMPSIKTPVTPIVKTTTKPITTNGSVKTYDRFKLGWRIRPRLTEDGRVVHDRIPLTSYDILHPQEGDFRVHSHLHMRLCKYLMEVFEGRIKRDPHAVVLHDTRVAWGASGPESHGPDVALIFGVREVKEWGTFDVNIEGTRPTLIVEVTSPETRRIDLDDKPDDYEQAGVQYYLIIDTYIGRRQSAYQLIGRQLTPEGYVSMIPDERGWLWLEPLQIWIGLNQNHLECYDKEGRRIGNYVDVSDERDEAKQQAKQERQRAEQERQRAEQEHQRAEQERQEKQLALSAAERYREKLRALGIDPDQL